MDYNGIQRSSIRAYALERLARMSVELTDPDNSLADSVPATFSRVLERTRKTSDLSGVPISQSELETLFALCKSAEYVKNQTQAEILLHRFQAYLSESKGQQFSSGQTVRNTLPTAWTRLTFELTTAISNLGLLFSSVLPNATVTLMDYANSFTGTGVNVTLYGMFSLAGFLQALIEKVEIVSPELISTVGNIFNQGFYDAVEDTILRKVTEDNDVEIIYGFEEYTGYAFSSLYFILLLGKLYCEYFKFLAHAPKDKSLTSHMLHSRSIAYNMSDDSKSLAKHIVDTYSAYNDYVAKTPNKMSEAAESHRQPTNTIKALALDVSMFGYVVRVTKFEYVRDIVRGYMDSLIKLGSNDMSYLIDVSNSGLLVSIFAASAILSEENPTIGLMLNKFFPTILSYPIVSKRTAVTLAECIACSLHTLSEDEVVSCIYSLANLLSDDEKPRMSRKSSQASSIIHNEPVTNGAPRNGQVAANDTDSVENYMSMNLEKVICRNVVSAILEIARDFKDDSINILVMTLLTQKIRRRADEFNCYILEGLIDFVDVMAKREFLVTLRYFYDTARNSASNADISAKTMDIWVKLSKRMAQMPDSELYTDYLHGLLTSIISLGDLDKDHHRSNVEVTASALKIESFLTPLAYLLPAVDQEAATFADKATVNLFRDAWFNLCIHGFTYNSEIYKRDYDLLLRIAHSTPPLASEFSWNRSETSIELNTILRRATSKRTEKLHKDTLSTILTTKSIDARVFESQISRPALMFLSAMLLVESLRADCGDCATALLYLSDPSVSIAKLETFVGAIAYYCCSRYIEKLTLGGSSQFTVSRITGQLQRIFVYCCHRDNTLQDVAFQCARRIVTLVPSSLCHERSAFAMLDILALLHDSIVDADTNEYEPSVEFKSCVLHINLSLSDSYVWRQKTLDSFTKFARESTLLSLSRCEVDLKSILYSYVLEAGSPHRTANYGVSFAMEMAGKTMSAQNRFYQLNVTGAGSESSSFLSQYENSAKTEKEEKIKALESKAGCGSGSLLDDSRRRVADFQSRLVKGERVSHKELVSIIGELTDVILLSPETPGDLVRAVVELPFLAFRVDNIEFAIGIWLKIMKCRREVSNSILSEILHQFEKTVVLDVGLYSKNYDLKDPEFYSMEYLPTNKKAFEHSAKVADANILPHLTLIRLLSSHFQACKYRSDQILKMFAGMVGVALRGLLSASVHPFSRLARFELINFAIDMLKTHTALQSRDVAGLVSLVLDASLSWFIIPNGSTPFGSNKLRMRAEYAILQKVATYFSKVSFSEKIQEEKRRVLLLFLDNEISFFASWLEPLSPVETTGNYCKYHFDNNMLQKAFMLDGRLAINLYKRYNRDGSLKGRIAALINSHPFNVVDDPSAIGFLTAQGNNRASSQAVVVWSSASPLNSITHFMPPYNKDPLILQYAMRSIESFDAQQTFFYVPQIVQTLRYDLMGYIQRYILETGNVSQLFAHQIIWNMSANSYKDEDSQVPDELKPTLDSVRDTMIEGFSPTDRDDYEKEFSFFNDVTGISGKLKPYIKKSKAEKKVKIDEEMAKIQLQEGVYLPSNPDGVVVDIDRKSGKPLQSHAKAPFMATFKIKRKVDRISDSVDDIDNDPLEDEYEVTKLSAIFKVGDDCRQDVLILQLMAIFRTVWMTSGLDVYIYPYRVTATSPGCGIIDVLPNSISRDMLGREAVNGLYEYFITQFGPETSTGFQKARNNFVKSMASYSLVTYLLALKDRHNGNIMYDNQGHVLHIDFGFCFDIAPGGVTFEQSPFKLTKEMVRVMGGSPDTQAYRWFEELCVKGFLACRPYMEAIVAAVEPMLQSGLPCFKPATIEHLRARFVPNKSTKDAAAYMRNLVRKSYESFATKGYDEFQKLTNGIPY